AAATRRPDHPPHHSSRSGGGRTSAVSLKRGVELLRWWWRRVMIRPPQVWLPGEACRGTRRSTIASGEEAVSRNALHRRAFVAVGALALAGGSLSALPAASTD